MILEKDGRVRLTPRELNVLRQSAACNGKAINTVATVDELFAAIVEGLEPSMAADLLEVLEQRHVDEREATAARWLVEQTDPDFSPEQRASLESWLVEDEENRHAYAAFERVWNSTFRLKKPD